jgi:hypothetical protein
VIGLNQSPAKLRHHVDAKARDVPDNWGLFHAKWRTEIASTTRLPADPPPAPASSSARLPRQHSRGWWGEGDEKVYVDSEKFPSWFAPARRTTSACLGHPPLLEPSRTQRNEERMQGCYRWHLGDNIPFYKSFVMTIENYTGRPTESKRNDYSSVAYWYQLPGGSDFFAPAPVADRIPRSYVANGAAEAERWADPGQLPPGVSIIGGEPAPAALPSRGLGSAAKSATASASSCTPSRRPHASYGRPRRCRRTSSARQQQAARPGVS